MTDRAPESELAAVQDAPATRAARRGTVGAVLRLLVLLFFVCGFALLALREFVLPRADEYREWVAERLAIVIGVPVSMDGLEADWSGPALRVRMSGLRVGEGDSALRLERVEAELGWSSLLRGQPYFRRVSLLGPRLTVVRETDGRLYVAGLAIEAADDGASGSDGFVAWLLRQGEVDLVTARVSWDDRLRGAPVLNFETFDLRVERTGGRYRFGLQGRPDAAIAQRIDLRGDLVSDDLADARRWNGQVYASVTGARLEGLAPWVDYPLPVSGEGVVEAWIGLEDGRPRTLEVDFALAGLDILFDETLPALHGAGARGRLRASRSEDVLKVDLQGFALEAGEDLRVEATDVDLELGRDGGALRVSSADLGVLSELSAHFPMPEDLRSRLLAHAPRGRVDDLRVAWNGPLQHAVVQRVEARVQGLETQAVGALPGLAGVDGELVGDAVAGQFRVTAAAMLDLPRVLAEGPLTFDQFDAAGGWARDGQGLAIRLERADFENEDAAGTFQGVYRPESGGPGDIDLTARLTRADGRAVWRYMPRTVGDKTRAWVRDAIVQARVSEAQLKLRGALKAFPFQDGSGEFVVAVSLDEGSLKYASGWPVIEDIVASLRFEGAGLRVSASEARIFGVKLREVVADLPDLDTRRQQPMSLHGFADGPTADFLRFVSESPVRAQVNGFTDDMQARGEGALELSMVMPLHAVNQTTLEGQFDFADNRVLVTDWLPPVDKARGRVKFSEQSFAIEEARGQALGAPLEISARTVRRGQVRFDVQGGLGVRALAAQYDWPLLASLSGSTSWQAVITAGEGTTRVELSSSLAGVSSSLPQPLNKRAAERWPARLEVAFAGQARDIRGEVGEHIRFALNGSGPPEDFSISRGGVAVGRPLTVPASGLSLEIETDRLDVDAWRELTGVTPGAEGLPWSDVNVRAGLLRIFDYDLQGFELVATRKDRAWGGRVASDLIRGGFGWRDGGQGTLALRLEYLRLGRPGAAESDLVRLLREEAARTSLPDMDVLAEHFYLDGGDLGRLELQARNEAGEWRLDASSITSQDAQLTARGRWMPETSLIQLAVRLEAANLGRFLARVGYPETVRGGTALLTGDLEWRGVPTRIDYASLNGSFRVDAGNGRFAQLEPGVGRLLGVLSLQSLPRRLTLDFSDVFSEGFSFDSIGGDVSMRSGVLSSDEIAIAGPAARVWIGGKADLLQETQDLVVVVQPTLSESIAIGAAAGLVNPVAGLVAFLAQKIMNDPIERMFAYGYTVTGQWDDPQVTKLPVGRGREATGMEEGP